VPFKIATHSKSKLVFKQLSKGEVMSLRQQLSEFCQDFETKMSYFENHYNSKKVDKIAKSMKEEFIKLDGSEKQHFILAEILLEATLDAILEYQIFEEFKEKNPGASITFETFDATSDYEKFMKRHLESLRVTIQSWKQMEPKNISSKILPYEKKMIPTSFLPTDSIEDWIFVIGTNYLPYGQVMKYKSKIRSILGKERFAPSLEFMLE
jgi:hypothetical protein